MTSETPIDSDSVTISCLSCFFRQVETIRVNAANDTQTVSLCHRYPPVLPGNFTTCPYPIVGAKDWCGEYSWADSSEKAHIQVPEQEVIGPLQETLQKVNDSGLVIAQQLPGNPKPRKTR